MIRDLHSLTGAPSSSSQPDYFLGHSDRELNRLALEARLVNPITYRFLRAAGIGPGMRVLDVGCGTGYVSLVVSDLVGDTGAVIGLDRSARALEAARATMSARSRRNVEFLEGDAAEMTFHRPFDAVVGRYVLTYQSDPVTMLARLAGAVRRGGIVAFQELDWDGARSSPPVPSYERCLAWLRDVLWDLDSESHMGLKLHQTFCDAGLPAPTMRLETLVAGAGGPNLADVVRLIVANVETMLPHLERFGIATAADVGVESLAQRIVREAAATNSVVAAQSIVGAWSTT
jgi:SAM-dependent methyltransferase